MVDLPHLQGYSSSTSLIPGPAYTCLQLLESNRPQNRGGDLDVLLLLLRGYNDNFRACRLEVLEAVQQQLCQHSGDRRDPQRNWQVLPCHTAYFVRLYHPILVMQLDVQVGKQHGGATGLSLVQCSTH